MRYRAVFPMLIIVFALSGCTLSTINPMKKSRIDNIHHTQILFFSDENQIDQEAPYYDALLDLEKDYPEQIDKMKVYDKKKAGKMRLKLSLPLWLLISAMSW